MKVLFYRYGSICEPDIIDVFNEMGLTVDEYKKEITEKDIPLPESVKQVSQYLLDNPADFVFSINFFPFLSEVCNIFHIRYLSWIVDAPVMELYSTSIKNEWNRTFIFDRAVYDDIHPYNEKCVFHLPLGARTAPKEELFKKESEADRKKFSHEIAFVGSLYTEKSPIDKLSGESENLRGYLDGIMKAQERVYGYYFIEELLSDDIVKEFKEHLPGFYTYPAETFLTDKRTMSQLYIGNGITAMERVDTFKVLSERFPVSIYTASDTKDIPKLHNMGLAKTLTEMPLIFKNSKINLNLTSKAIRTGLPLRIFDILSCGGFIISNYQPEIPELFTPGEDLVMYGSFDELLYFCDYYLSHDDERIQIAEAGYEKLKANYTYEKQLEKLLFTAFSF